MKYLLFLPISLLLFSCQQGPSSTFDFSLTQNSDESYCESGPMSYSEVSESFSNDMHEDVDIVSYDRKEEQYNVRTISGDDYTLTPTGTTATSYTIESN
ncbi:MAG: hypothetical protein K2M31_04130 [Muribaculaceae bacterium]|nr:hypothetical protein [Muribaculaceae bacterium]